MSYPCTVLCCCSPGSIFTSIIVSFNKTVQIVKVVHCSAAASLHIWLHHRLDTGLETSLGTVFSDCSFFSLPYLFFFNYPGVNFVMLCYAESQLKNCEHLQLWLHAVMHLCSSALRCSSAGTITHFASSMYFKSVVLFSHVGISFCCTKGRKAFLAKTVL